MKDLREFTQEDLAKRWNCSVRTVKRDVRKYQLIPARLDGRLLIYLEPSVVEMEQRRQTERLKALGYPAPKIVSMGKLRREREQAKAAR